MSQLRQAPNSSGLYDVVNLILDKGMVVDAYVRVSLVGIELLTVEARVVIASVDTFIRYAEAMERLGMSLNDRSSGKGLPDLVNDSIADRATSRTIERGKKHVREVFGGNDEHDSSSGLIRNGARQAAKAAGAAAIGAVGQKVAGTLGDDKLEDADDDDAVGEVNGNRSAMKTVGRGIREVAHKAAKAVGGQRTAERTRSGRQKVDLDDDDESESSEEAEYQEQPVRGRGAKERSRRIEDEADEDLADDDSDFEDSEEVYAAEEPAPEESKRNKKRPKQLGRNRR